MPSWQCGRKQLKWFFLRFSSSDYEQDYTFSPEFEEVDFSVMFTARIFGLKVILCYFWPHLGLILHACFYLWGLGVLLVVAFKTKFC